MKHDVPTGTGLSLSGKQTVPMRFLSKGIGRFSFSKAMSLSNMDGVL